MFKAVNDETESVSNWRILRRRDSLIFLPKDDGLGVEKILNKYHMLNAVINCLRWLTWRDVPVLLPASRITGVLDSPAISSYSFSWSVDPLYIIRSLSDIPFTLISIIKPLTHKKLWPCRLKYRIIFFVRTQSIIHLSFFILFFFIGIARWVHLSNQWWWSCAETRRENWEKGKLAACRHALRGIPLSMWEGQNSSSAYKLTAKPTFSDDAGPHSAHGNYASIVNIQLLCLEIHKIDTEST